MKHQFSDITAKHLHENLINNVHVYILDVREPIEYHTYNIGGLNIPLSRLADSLTTLNYRQDDEIVVICQRGLRSETACNLLRSLGFSNVRNLSGGLLAYRRMIQ